MTACKTTLLSCIILFFTYSSISTLIILFIINNFNLIYRVHFILVQLSHRIHVCPNYTILIFLVSKMYRNYFWNILRCTILRIPCYIENVTKKNWLLMSKWLNFISISLQDIYGETTSSLSITPIVGFYYCNLHDS